ncbi:TcpQ domain-containing protein [Idiomarina xiamenensis]|uniref:Toxin co-regulated pilus biosynthesis protein Q C-terminal domain-containing protein n=1 Tax=Idiomarina xiamenensis 10-D-4 TaxID=740709 RepID=K2KMN5_9GAMM|nr:TcpQ domain-containing protein [Idiomarina xiamenensis]EKE83699.1 hypothetical protein A10D4_07620 [Idiomarina xiamenensis 10-D-4]
MPRSRSTKRQQPPKKALNGTHWFLILFIVLIGGLLLFFREQLFTGYNTGNTVTGSGFAKRSAFQQTSIDNMQNNISRFFAGITSSLFPGDHEDSIYVIELTRSNKSLGQVLANLTSDNPLVGDWRGERDQFWFMENDTVKQRLESIARQRDINFIWWLDRDYVVKSAFQIDDTFTGAIDRVARTVNHDFMDNINAYLCSTQRALVISDEQAAEQLPSNCYAVGQAANANTDTDVDEQTDEQPLPNLRQQQ